MQIEALKIRSTVYEAISDYYRTIGFWEVTPPILTSFSCEVACVGGSDLISVNYYDKKAYLSQSGQLYLEALAMQLGRVYCIDPAFRAESTLLATHLSEFWMCEAEMIDTPFEGVIQNINDLLISIVSRVLAKNGAELKALGVDTARLKSVIGSPMPQITYTDAIKCLKEDHMPVNWGDDISASHEILLSKYFHDSPFIITHYPRGLSSFYKQECPEDKSLTLSFDIIAPDGYGELVGGSMRENDPEKLRKALTESAGSLETFAWYLQLIAENPNIHGGYGLGIERLLSWLCGLPTIQDAIPFPRTEDNLCP